MVREYTVGQYMKALSLVSIFLGALGLLWALSILLPNSDFEGGSGFASMFAVLACVIAIPLAIIPNCFKASRGQLSGLALVASLAPLLALLLIDFSQRRKLRIDLSTEIVYLGKHEEILLGCTDSGGSFKNRKTRRGEKVLIDSVRDDGRIVITWGPAFRTQQTQDLQVGPDVPSGGPPVTVLVVLDDDEASFTFGQ